MNERHVVVIGGGASGTSAAHSLLNAGCRVTIIEQLPRLGGRIHSPEMGNQRLEVGGGFITKAYSNTHALLKALNLANHVSTHTSHSAIMRGGQIYQLSAANLVWRHKLLSPRAKWRCLPLIWRALRAGRQLNIHDFSRAAGLDLKSVRDAFPGHAGSELVNYLLDCALNGYFYWSPEQISEAMLLMILRVIASGGHAQTLTGGMQQLPIEAARGSQVILSTKVERIEPADGAFRVHITTASGPSTLTANGVVCATTASVVPKIMTLQPDRKVFFESIKYSATAVAVRHYLKPVSLPATAIAFPRLENIPAAAITTANEANDDNSQGTHFVKCYASGDLGPVLSSASDRQILNTLDPARLLNDSALGTANVTELQRWPEALPVFGVGHFGRLHAFARGRIEDRNTPVVFAGDYLGGPFIEGAVTSGQQAAQRLLERLGATRK